MPQRRALLGFRVRAASRREGLAAFLFGGSPRIKKRQDSASRQHTKTDRICSKLAIIDCKLLSTLDPLNTSNFVLMQDVNRLTTADRDLAAEKFSPTPEFGGFTLAFE